MNVYANMKKAVAGVGILIVLSMFSTSAFAATKTTTTTTKRNGSVVVTTTTTSRHGHARTTTTKVVKQQKSKHAYYKRGHAKKRQAKARHTHVVRYEEPVLVKRTVKKPHQPVRVVYRR